MQRNPLAAAALGVACLAALGASAALPWHPASAADDPYAGVEVLRGLFVSNDYNRDGRISPREVNVFAGLVFVSMDADEDGRATLQEFMAWDPGFAAMADQRGKTAAFEAAKREVFKAWDRNDDGNLDETEMAVRGAHDFVVADRDDDGSLGPHEYAAGYPILAAIAKAIR